MEKLRREQGISRDEGFERHGPAARAGQKIDRDGGFEHHGPAIKLNIN